MNIFSLQIFIYVFSSFLQFIMKNQANGLACQGKYEAGSIPSFAANASLFVKSHAY